MTWTTSSNANVQQQFARKVFLCHFNFYDYYTLIDVKPFSYRLLSIVFAKKPFSCYVNFFQGAKETQTVQVWNHRINQTNACTQHFFAGFTKRKKQRNNKKNYKRQAFFVARNKKEIFCFHVCFNLKLAAKQQHFHCFLAQCRMRGCQLTEVFSFVSSTS